MGTDNLIVKARVDIIVSLEDPGLAALVGVGLQVVLFQVLLVTLEFDVQLHFLLSTGSDLLNFFEVLLQVVSLKRENSDLVAVHRVVTNGSLDEAPILISDSRGTDALNEWQVLLELLDTLFDFTGDLSSLLVVLAELLVKLEANHNPVLN